MYDTGEAIAFFFVFLCQVLLISWYFPRRITSRMRYVLDRCPPSTHPKMYVRPVEHYERVVRNFARLNGAIAVVGVSIVAALVFGTFATEWNGAIVTPFSTSGEWDAAIVTPFFLLQFIPFAYLEMTSRYFYRAMAKSAPPRVRTTELRRRRLVDFVSPALLVAAALIYVAFVLFVLWYQRFGFEWFTAFGNITIITVMNVAMGVMVGFVVYGRWPDHHQAHQDRVALIKLVVTRAMALVMAVPVLIAAQLIIKLFDPAASCAEPVCDEYLEPVISSVYHQIVAALILSFYNHRVESVDFDVYRGDARDSTAAI